MGYLLKTVVGAALFLGGIILFNVELIGLLKTGTCASGGPYEISQPCPEGTGTDILLLMGSIFGGLIGAAIFAFRGESPWGSGKSRWGGFFGLGTFAWGLFFAATGASALIFSLGYDDDGAGGKLGGMIVGVTFLFMGVPALVISLWGFFKSFGSDGGRGSRSASAGSVGSMTTASTPGAASAATVGRAGAGDTIGRVERLQKLRESGALSDAEFEREKAKILAEQ
jgi:hypothetical protein